MATGILLNNGRGLFRLLDLLNQTVMEAIMMRHKREKVYEPYM